MPRPDRLALAAAALVWAAAGSVWAAAPQQPQPDRRLKELESALEKSKAEREELKQKAQALAEESAKIRMDMVAAARSTQEFEDQLSDLEGQLQDLKGQEAQKSKALARRSEQMTGVLTALQRLAWRPSEALIAQPTSPADTVRSAILLRAAVPQIEESARELRQELDSLRELRTDIGQQRQKIAATATKLDNEHKRLTAMFQRKAQLQQRTEEEGKDAERRSQRMAAEAQDLRELMARLEEERKRKEAEEAARIAAEKAAKAAALAAAKAAAQKAGKPPPHEQQDTTHDAAEPSGRLFSKAEGQIPYPARGRLLTHFGQTTELGTPSKGIMIETRSGAQVIAPYDGRVAFAGTFRGYGQLLIIEHSEGYHTLLAGLGRIDSKVGQRLEGGEPVGVMGQSEGKPTLYVELRRNGQPVNPLPWLTARKDKVSG